MIRMSIAERSGQPKLFTFPKDDITIGRAQGNDIILPRNNISKRHTRVFRRQGKLVVRDMDSTNGTFLNGRRIHDDEVLHAGDRIFLADFVLIVEEDESAATPVPPELKTAAPPPLPPDELSAEVALPDQVEEISGRETIPAEDASEISLAAADLETAPPDMVLADLAKAASRRPAAEPPRPVEPPMPAPIHEAPVAAPIHEAPVPARPARILTPSAPVPAAARRAAEIPASTPTPAPAAPRPVRLPTPAPIPAPAPAAAQAPSLFDEDEGTPPPAAPRGRGRAAAAEPEERPAPAPRPTAAPKGGRTAAKPEPKPKAPKAVTTLPEAEVAERLLARVNEVVRLKDAEPAVFGDPELQAKVKSAVLDELAILEAEDLIDAGLDRDGLVERLTSSLFGLGPIAAVAADEGVEAFVVHPNGVAFERRQGKWRRAGQRLDPALLSLVARRLASGIEGRGRGGSAESFRGRHAGLPGVEVCGALGGSTLPGAMLRLERPAALPDDFDRLADAGLLSMSMATFLRMCLDGRQAIAVAGPQRAARTAVLRALVAGLPAEERVVWVADRGDGGPPESAATIVTVTPPSTGEALLEEADDGGAGLADVIQWLQPGVVVIERAEPGRDVALVRAIRNRLGGLVLSVETDRWEPAGEEPGAPGQALRPPGGAATRSGPAGGVDRRLASHVDVVVELAALMDGSSRTLRVAERAAEGGDPFALTAIFEYAVTGTTEGGEVSGEYRATRAVPRFLERRKARGKRVDLSLFQG